MIRNLNMGITRQSHPAFAELQRRRAELLNNTPDPEPDPEPGPAPQPPPQPRPTPLQAPAKFHLREQALYGLAGQVVRTLAPHTEAHPAAILLQFLAAFGNAVGPGPHCLVGPTRHRLNLFVVLVGESSKARKGTSWNQIERRFAEVDQPWVNTRITTARLGAAGLVYALRDQQPPTDRRLLALAEEFASILHTIKRARGHLSSLLRCAWDNGHLRMLDGSDPLRATNTHISLIAHITERELAQHLDATDAHNGFANRCLWTSVHRSQCLPSGGALAAHELIPITQQLRQALDWAATPPTDIVMKRDHAAESLWEECYPDLSQARPGLFGAATSRAEAQVLRLSAVYAALDCSPLITVPHLEAALAVWEYCSASASELFGTSTGDLTADRIKVAIEESKNGLSRDQIRGLFHGHVSRDRIEAALEQLISLGVLTHHLQPGRGRPASVWSAIPDAQEIDRATAQEGP
jgi:hypothetical protein